MVERTKAMRIAVFIATTLPTYWALNEAAAQPAGSAPVYDCENAYAGGESSDFFDTPLYQGKDGWFFRYGSDLSDTQVISPDAVSKMAKVNQVLSKRGTKLIYLPVPTRGVLGQKFLPVSITDGVIYDQELAVESHINHVNAMREAGITAVDLASTLKLGPPKEQLSLARDLHWTPEGARWVAQESRKVFDDFPAFAALAKIKFETMSLGEKPYNSQMYEALAGVCGTQENMTEKVNGYETKRVGATADDLLGGETEVSSIALVGTSFSDTDIFNFEGFLSQALETEVANFSISGGGQFTSLYKWALTEGQKPDLPKFLIWETPIYNRFDDQQYLIMFRQIIAALHGPCGEKNIAMTGEKIVLSGTEPKRITIPAGTKLRGDDATLRFTAPGQNLQRLSLELEYGNGESELLNLVQPGRVGTLDTFQITLNEEMDGGLTALTVRGFAETSMDILVDVCDFQGEKL
jgi:alginate biosynthesis protein AlgX